MDATMTAVQKLQDEQSAFRSAAYDALSRGDDTARLQANIDYDLTVAKLVAILGHGAHCADVDCDLYGFYSDAYKDRNGFRPRGQVTRKEVLEWMDFYKDVPFDDDDDPSIGAEDFTLVARVFSDPEPLPYEEFEYLEGR